MGTYSRCVGLLIYMSLTALGFAAWNVGTSRAAGVNGEHTSIRFTQVPVWIHYYLSFTNFLTLAIWLFGYWTISAWEVAVGI